MRRPVWAPLGAVVLAAASSACCWLPLLALGGGIGLGSAAIMLERYRWVLLGAAAVLIGLGFYLNYRRDETCAPDGSCRPLSTRLRTINRVVLWICAGLVVLFALFPQVLTAWAPQTSPDSASVTRLTSDARELRDAFNRDLGTVRIVVLLSPT